MAERIQEYASSAGVALRVDREKCLVHGVKVLGLRSANGREYTPKAVAEAIGKYEGAPVFVDHLKPGTARSYRDRNGRLVNVRASTDGIFADHAYNPKHPVTEMYLEDAERAPGNVGLSHDIMGVIEKKDGKTYVTEITEVNSVDLVARPATNVSLFESSELPQETAARELAEHGLNVAADARLILLSEDSLESKKSRLQKILEMWQRELREGEIANKLAQDENARYLRRVNSTADDLMSEALYNNDVYPTVEAKKARILSVLADWESEIRKLPVASGKKESVNMELKDLTLEQLKADRKDLVEAITAPLSTEAKNLSESLKAKDAELVAANEKLAVIEGEKAAIAKQAKIAEELKAAGLDTANKTVCSEAFMAVLNAAADEAARKPLLEDRVALAKAMQPSRGFGAAPFANVGDQKTGPGNDPKETLARL